MKRPRVSPSRLDLRLLKDCDEVNRAGNMSEGAWWR